MSASVFPLKDANGFLQGKTHIDPNYLVMPDRQQIVSWTAVDDEHLLNTGRYTPFKKEQLRPHVEQELNELIKADNLCRQEPLPEPTPAEFQQAVDGMIETREYKDRKNMGWLSTKMSLQKPTFVDITNPVLDELDELDEDDPQINQKTAEVFARALDWQESKVPATNMTKKKDSLFTSFSEMKLQGMLILWIIKAFIEANTTGMVFGPPGKGKSFIVLHWLLCVATGIIPWLGRTTNKGLSVAFVGEGYPGYTRRLEAFRIHYGLSDQDIDRNLVISKTRIPFDDDLESIAEEIQNIAAQRGQAVRLIAIDTLARHTPDGADENSSKDMSLFISRVDALRQSFPGSTAIIVHHSGHSDASRGRGSSSLHGAMDFAYKVTDDCLSCEKMKDAAEPDDLGFKLLPVDLGVVDEDGKPITSCVPVFGDKPVKSIGLTAHQRTAVDTLVSVSSSKLGEFINNQYWGCLVGDWRSAYNESTLIDEPGVSTGTINRRFDRAVKELTEKGLLVSEGHHRVLTSPAFQQDIITMQIKNCIDNQ